MADKGTNCALKYPGPKGMLGYRLKVDMLTYGISQISMESQARRHKAFYPHRSIPTRFAIRANFPGYVERTKFSRWLQRYMRYLLDEESDVTTPQMRVHLPDRNFIRWGIPLDGMDLGDHLGSMLFSPVITFETSGEPQDLNDTLYISEVYADLARLNSPVTEYFYPTGTQLAGDEAPPPDIQNAPAYPSPPPNPPGTKHPHGGTIEPPGGV